MSRTRFWTSGRLILAVALSGGCSADDGGGSCAPTDPTCNAPAASPLVVASVSPANGANHVEYAAPVIVTFSRPVEAASVTAATFSVGQAAGSLAVSGATVTFTPAAPLAASADHQVRVQGVRDAAGVGMAAPFTSMFTTRSAPVCGECPATSFSREDVQAQGAVVQTPEGFTVDGTLSLKTGENSQITFLGADVDVRFDANGRLRSISGKVQIPSPHERIVIGDPIRADVGIFTGRFLNEERDLGILLKDDTDYLVFDFEQQLNLSIATGETGSAATKPIVVRSPDGKRTLMVVDYRDPMYYVYGQHNLLGAAGTGWSLNGRIPFVPKQTVNGLGTFDGRSTRTGTFPVFRIMSVTGQLVDNHTTELHLSESDPFASDLGASYESGFNGELSLDLSAGNIGLEIGIASASGGVRAAAGTHSGFNGYAFVRGTTSRDDSWWPAFIPVRPLAELDTHARVESDGSFETSLAGEFGWELPAGRQTMSGSVGATNQSLTLAGAIRDGSVNLNITGVISADNTRVLIAPPPELLDRIHSEINDQVLTQIAAAEKAYADLVKATADYQFELSLRGIRQLIPGIVTVAKQGIDDGIRASLKNHEGRFYYNTLLGLVNTRVQPWRDRLDAVATAVARSDDATTRIVLRNALTDLVANRTISVTVGITGVITHTFTRDILTAAQASQISQAASYIQYIQPASDLRISMQQVYNVIPDRQIFEQVRDDIVDGVLIMESIGELGFVYPHSGPPAFNAYAVIGGTRYEVGSIEALTIDALLAKLAEPMILALRSN
ncbi:MAG: Ig-like domain-containing protein [Gemmatimonadetes bacterium]|nr:Ig-like domain-containing protein [Gemmatimonadota bacterium]